MQKKNIKNIKKKKTHVKNLPKNSKFKRLHKGIVTPIEYKKSASHLYYGVYGLKILKNGRLTVKQLNAAKQKITRVIRKKEKLWIRGFTDIPVTQKPNEIRMGKGKGSLAYWILRVKSGSILFEISHMSRKKAFILLRSASNKLPIPSMFIKHSKRLITS